MTVDAILIADQFDKPVYTYFKDDKETPEIQFALYAALDTFSIISEKNRAISEDPFTYAILTPYNHKITVYCSEYITLLEAQIMLLDLAKKWQKITLSPFYSKNNIQELSQILQK